MLDDFVTVEWLELRNTDAFFGGIAVDAVSAANNVVLRNNLIHDTGSSAIRVYDPDAIVDIIGNVAYGVSSTTGIWLNVGASWTGSARVRVLNNTVFGSLNYGVYSDAGTNAQVLLRNNLSHSNGWSAFQVPSPDPASSHNLASDGTGTTHSPAGGGVDNVPLTGAPGVNFVNTTSGTEDLHIQDTSRARNAGADLSAIFNRDVDYEVRPTGAGTWDIGADEYGLHGGQARLVHGPGVRVGGPRRVGDGVGAGQPGLPSVPGRFPTGRGFG